MHMVLLLLMTSSLPIAIGKDDVACLHGFKSSVSDPYGELSTWNLSTHTTTGFICSFSGLSCWNLQENRVISISLPSLSLSGPIPSALGLCSSVTSLDLSDNNLSGPIPASLCTWLPYLVFLNLSSNSLAGPIPPDLSACTYLNSLVLSSNKFSGSVPRSLSLLQGLQKLELADNDLSGAVPVGLGRSGASSFPDNPSLCGHPVSDCREPIALTNIVAVVDLVAGVLGFLLSLAISYAVWRCCITTLPRPKFFSMRITNQGSLISGSPGSS